MLADVFPTHRATVVPHAVEQPVEGAEQIKQTSSTGSLGLQSVGIARIQNKPSDKLREVVRFPLARDVAFGKSDRTIKNAAFEKLFLGDVNRGPWPIPARSIGAIRSIRQSNLQTAALEFGETIENQSAKKHVFENRPSPPYPRAAPCRDADSPLEHIRNLCQSSPMKKSDRNEQPKKSLQLLGTSSALPQTPSRDILETFPNTHPARGYVIRVDTRDFSSLCPVTGQPDYAELVIEYVPAIKCVETKSLKYYLASFRNTPSFNEQIVNRILDDLVAVCGPRSMTVEGAFAARGGLSLTVTASHEAPSKKSKK